jgi:hypothetical protein
MPETAPFKLPLRSLLKIHHVDHSLLGRWLREGIGVMDSWKVAKRVLFSQLPVKAWQVTKVAIYTEDGESHEHWKKQKTQEEVESYDCKTPAWPGKSLIVPTVNAFRPHVREC